MNDERGIRIAGRWRGRPWVKLAMDTVVLALAFVLAYQFRTGVITRWRYGIQAGEFYLTPGLVVVAIGVSFGGMHGYAINPARDFGPRLFTAVAGFRNNGLTDGSLVFLVPIAGPILGGIVGAATWEWGLRRFLPAK